MIELAKLQQLHQQWLGLINEATRKKEKTIELMCSVRRAMDVLTQQNQPNPEDSAIQTRLEEHEALLQNGMVLLERLQKIILDFQDNKTRVEQLIGAWKPEQHSPSI